MSDGVLAEITDYDSLLALMREVSVERELTREGLDSVAGLPSGYTGKLLAPIPAKKLGPTSMGPVLAALGIKLYAVRDEEAIRRFAGIVAANKAQRPKAINRGLVPPEIEREFRRRLHRQACARMRKARAMRNIVLSPEERSRIARHAAQARWARMRKKKRSGADRAKPTSRPRTSPPSTLGARAAPI